MEGSNGLLVHGPDVEHSGRVLRTDVLLPAIPVRQVNPRSDRSWPGSRGHIGPDRCLPAPTRLGHQSCKGAVWTGRGIVLPCGLQHWTCHVRGNSGDNPDLLLCLYEPPGGEGKPPVPRPSACGAWREASLLAIDVLTFVLFIIAFIIVYMYSEGGGGLFWPTILISARQPSDQRILSIL